jgi:hypothetical protein
VSAKKHGKLEYQVTRTLASVAVDGQHTHACASHVTFVIRDSTACSCPLHETSFPPNKLNASLLPVFCAAHVVSFHLFSCRSLLVAVALQVLHLIRSLEAEEAKKQA